MHPLTYNMASVYCEYMYYIQHMYWNKQPTRFKSFSVVYSQMTLVCNLKVKIMVGLEFPLHFPLKFIPELMPSPTYDNPEGRDGQHYMPLPSQSLRSPYLLMGLRLKQ